MGPLEKIDRALAVLRQSVEGFDDFPVPFGYLVPIGQGVYLPPWYDPAFGLAEYLSYNLLEEAPAYLVIAEETDGFLGLIVDLAQWFGDREGAVDASEQAGEGLFDCSTGEECDPPEGLDTRWVRGVLIRANSLR